MFDNATPWEWIRVVVSIVGLLAQILAILDAIADKRVLRELKKNGVRMLLVNSHIRHETIRLIVILILGYLGVISLFRGSIANDYITNFITVSYTIAVVMVNLSSFFDYKDKQTMRDYLKNSGKNITKIANHIADDDPHERHEELTPATHRFQQ